MQLNTDFQRPAQRHKKAFFNEQCIKLEESNRRGKTRDLFRKIGAIKGTFCPKMGTIKDINGGDLVVTEEIKNKWKEYTEELYKKDPSEPHDVLSHTEPDILECEVMWALGSTAANKACGCDEILVELFKTLENRWYQGIAFNMLANLEDPAMATGLEKVNPQSSCQEG